MTSASKPKPAAKTNQRGSVHPGPSAAASARATASATAGATPVTAAVLVPVALAVPRETERVRPVLDVALARFQHEEALRRELADARSQLQERKQVERAKGLLMQRQGLSEAEAYARLRKTAMDKGLKLGEVAQRVIDLSDLLG